MSSQAVTDIQSVDDMFYADLVQEQGELAIGIALTASMPYSARMLALASLRVREENISRALQAFEKVTYRHLKSFGTMPRT
jgi:hypothetical protein